MTTKTRWSVSTLLVLMMAAGAFETLLARAMTAPTMGDRGVAWAASLSPSERLDAAMRVESLPNLYRRALVSRLPSESRAEMFRQYFDRYAGSHPGLSASQRALLGRAPALLSLAPAKMAQTAVIIAFADFESESHRLFTPEVERELFYTLGPRVSEPVTARLVGWLAKQFVVAAEDSALPWCACTTQNWFSCGGCHTTSMCRAYSPGWFWEDFDFLPLEVPVWGGCGFGMAYACNGACAGSGREEEY